MSYQRVGILFKNWKTAFNLLCSVVQDIWLDLSEDFYNCKKGQFLPVTLCCSKLWLPLQAAPLVSPISSISGSIWAAAGQGGEEVVLVGWWFLLSTEWLANSNHNMTVTGLRWCSKKIGSGCFELGPRSLFLAFIRLSQNVFMMGSIQSTCSLSKRGKMNCISQVPSVDIPIQCVWKEPGKGNSHYKTNVLLPGVAVQGNFLSMVICSTTLLLMCSTVCAHQSSHFPDYCRLSSA